MRMFRFKGLRGLALVFMLGALGSFHGTAAAESKGVILLAKISGEVKVQVDGKLDPTGKPLFLSSEQVKAGASIFAGHTIVTGKAKGSSAILLFSNGAVVSLEEDSQLNLNRFMQVPFTSAGKKVSELPEEPSSSLTMLNLNYGQMVIGVKKLAQRSRFYLTSPVGTADFRGGDNALGLSARPTSGGGFVSDLIVSRGSVVFKVAPRTPGAPSQAIPLAAGMSLRPTVNSAGAPTVPSSAPATASKLQAITETLTATSGATASTTLDIVSAALRKSESQLALATLEKPEPEPEPEPVPPPAVLNGKRSSSQNGAHLENAPLGNASNKPDAVHDKSKESGKADPSLKAGEFDANGAVESDTLADDKTTIGDSPDATSRLRHNGVQNNDRRRGPHNNFAGVGGGGKRQDHAPPSARHPKNRAELVNWTEQKVWSQVAYNTPKTIAYEELSYIQLSINPSFTAEEIAEVVKERGPVETARIKVTREMEATLTGSAFKITPISSERQMIELDDTTTWKWEILPLEPGRHRVHLVINAIVRVAGKELRRSKSFDRYIEIEVTGFQRTVIFMQKNWPWLALAFAPFMFFGPVRSSRFWKNRRAAKGLSVSRHDESRNLDVFVSYSSKDRVVVLQLVETLRAHGYNVWVDKGGIHGASQWSEQIVHAIEGASAFLLVSSPHSFASHNVVKETSLASERRKHVIPVFIDEAEIPQNLQYQLAGLQHVEYSEHSHEESMQRIVEALTKLGIAGSEEAS